MMIENEHDWQINDHMAFDHMALETDRNRVPESDNTIQ